MEARETRAFRRLFCRNCPGWNRAVFLSVSLFFFSPPVSAEGRAEAESSTSCGGFVFLFPPVSGVRWILFCFGTRRVLFLAPTGPGGALQAPPGLHPGISGPKNEYFFLGHTAASKQNPQQVEITPCPFT